MKRQSVNTDKVHTGVGAGGDGGGDGGEGRRDEGK